MIEVHTKKGKICYTDIQICEFILEKEGFVLHPFMDLWIDSNNIKIHRRQVYSNPIGIVTMYLKLNWNKEHDDLKQKILGGSSPHGSKINISSSCSHELKEYVGINEIYKYCSKCGIKK